MAESTPDQSHANVHANVPAGAPAAAPVPAPASPAVSGTTHRDLQRAAMRDLVQLATESAATEAEVEARYQAGLEEARRKFESANFAAEERLKTAREEVEQKHAERVAKVANTYESERKTLLQADKVTRQRATAEAQKVEQDVKAKFDQAVWLVDSVYEVDQNRIKEDAKKIREEITAHLGALDAMETRAGALLEAQGQAVPPAAEEDAGNAPGVAPQEADAKFVSARDDAERHLNHLASRFLPKLFSGGIPYLLLILLVAGAGAAVQGSFHTLTPQVQPLAIACGATFAGAIVLGILLKMAARRSLLAAHAPFRHSLAEARRAAKQQIDNAVKQQEQQFNLATAKRKKDVQAAKEKYNPFVEKARQKRDAALAAQKAELAKAATRTETQRDATRAEADDRKARALAELQQKFDREVLHVRQAFDKQTHDVQHQYDEARGSLDRRLHEGLEHAQAPIDGEIVEGRGEDAVRLQTWDQAAWKAWKPSKKFAAMVRFGELEVDLKKIAAAGVPPKPVRAPKPGDRGAALNPPERGAPAPGGQNGQNGPGAPGNGQTPAPLGPRLNLPETFGLPASLAFPSQASLLIQCDRSLRDEGLKILQMVMTRLLTRLPPGRVRFTILDPVGLGQNFAGFMHLADHDEALVGTRIWTEGEQIEQRLADLTEHMETVIQKYLRNEYETIDAYNAQAGELAEPYRFLVISDFPVGFGSGDGLRRLSSIASSGARCGIYTLVLRDNRQDAPSGTVLDDLEAHSVNIVQEKVEKTDEDGQPTGEVISNKFVWKDEVFKQFPLKLDPPPTEEVLTQILDKVGKGAKEAKRVEVNFDTIAPKFDEYWTASSNSEISVPVGRMGATRLQYLKLGKGVAQHVLIAGKTGSGKSTLLHALVTNIAMWYSPEQVEFYLIDFKKGVEFKTYADNNLPHARAIAVESDREFGLSVLQRLDVELTRRGDIFRKVGVQDLNSYRNTPNPQVMPRTLLIIDEFQEFFTEDDKLAQDASLLLDRLVRQGRAFGMHVLLGSQTIGGSSGLPRTTIGQMGVRVALQTSEADSHLILGDGNSAARLLTRPGEAIYNDQGGLVEANSPFQVAWLSDPQRDAYLAKVNKKEKEAEAKSLVTRLAPPLVFEGNAPADLTKNVRLNQLIGTKTPPPTSAPSAWLGDPVAIKEPTAVVMRRQTGANLMIIGQQDESALAMLGTAMLSLAAHHTPDGAVFYVLDGSPPDAPWAGTFPYLKTLVPQQVKMVEWRSINDAVAEVAGEVERRQSGGQGGDTPAGESGPPNLYLFIYGLQRYRMLRKSDDDFSFSINSSDEAKKPNAGKQFADILREGPTLGVHVLAWTDTPVSVERTLDRGGLREFDNRVLFQMSANDSSNLIDSPLGNKLGVNRALVFSEEQGILEKFRPYALPHKDWLEQAKEQLLARGKAKETPVATVPGSAPSTTASTREMPEPAKELTKGMDDAGGLESAPKPFLNLEPLAKRFSEPDGDEESGM